MPIAVWTLSRFSSEREERERKREREGKKTHKGVAQWGRNPTPCGIGAGMISLGPSVVDELCVRTIVKNWREGEKKRGARRGGDCAKN